MFNKYPNIHFGIYTYQVITINAQKKFYSFQGYSQQVYRAVCACACSSTWLTSLYVRPESPLVWSMSCSYLENVQKKCWISLKTMIYGRKSLQLDKDCSANLHIGVIWFHWNSSGLGINFCVKLWGPNKIHNPPFCLLIVQI